MLSSSAVCSSTCCLHPACTSSTNPQVRTLSHKYASSAAQAAAVCCCDSQHAAHARTSKGMRSKPDAELHNRPPASCSEPRRDHTESRVPQTPFLFTRSTPYGLAHTCSNQATPSAHGGLRPLSLAKQPCTERRKATVSALSENTRGSRGTRRLGCSRRAGSCIAMSIYKGARGPGAARVQAQAGRQLPAAARHEDAQRLPHPLMSAVLHRLWYRALPHAPAPHHNSAKWQCTCAAPGRSPLPASVTA
jgi:hypothetical protein